MAGGTARLLGLILWGPSLESRVAVVLTCVVLAWLSGAWIGPTVLSGGQALTPVAAVGPMNWDAPERQLGLVD